MIWLRAHVSGDATMPSVADATPLRCMRLVLVRPSAAALRRAHAPFDHLADCCGISPCICLCLVGSFNALQHCCHPSDTSHMPEPC